MILDKLLHFLEDVPVEVILRYEFSRALLFANASAELTEFIIRGENVCCETANVLERFEVPTLRCFKEDPGQKLVVLSQRDVRLALLL
jgi:hypothetical protein